MKLLYLVDHWPGLFEAYLLREIQWMRERGHEVAVLALGSGGPHGFRNETKGHVHLAQFDLDDLPVLQLDSKHLSTKQIIRESLLFVRDHQVEFIDAHLAREPAEIACRIHRVSGVPFGVRMRGGDIHSNTSPKLAEILHYASAVCPMSQFLADVLVGSQKLKQAPCGIPAKVRPGTLHVVPGCLPANCLAAKPAAQSDQSQIIGAIGRVVPVKRFQDIIEAVAGLVADFPGVKLKIIGGGILERDLQISASRLGIADRVEITGFKTWAEVMNLARQLHIYVHASELEGFGLATIEAAFQGIPLVLSRTGVNEECVMEGINGHLFDPGDVTTLREGLRSLLLVGARKREQMGNATLEIVGQRFSAETIMPRVEAMFRNAIGNQAQLMWASSGMVRGLHDVYKS